MCITADVKPGANLGFESVVAVPQGKHHTTINCTKKACRSAAALSSRPGSFMAPQAMPATRHSKPAPAAATSNHTALRACGPDKRACKRLPMR